MIVSALTLLTVASLTQSFLVADHVKCIRDTSFEFTQGLNNYFAMNPSVKHGYTIFCGLLMDTMVLFLLFRFAFYGKTWRLIATLFVFYLVRLIIQVIIVSVIDYSNSLQWPFLLTIFGSTLASILSQFHMEDKMISSILDTLVAQSFVS